MSAMNQSVVIALEQAKTQVSSFIHFCITG